MLCNLLISQPAIRIRSSDHQQLCCEISLLLLFLLSSSSLLPTHRCAVYFITIQFTHSVVVVALAWPYHYPHQRRSISPSLVLCFETESVSLDSSRRKWNCAPSYHIITSMLPVYSFSGSILEEALTSPDQHCSHINMITRHVIHL